MATRDLGKAFTDLAKPDGTGIIQNGIKTALNYGSVLSNTGLTNPKATDILKTNGTSSVKSDPKKITPTGKKDLYSVFPNPLEEFASYNVLWTLACLTPKQFNNPSTYRNSPKDLEHVVFSSGGRFDSQRVKTYYGTPEYYINNFQMDTIIASNEKTGNSNAVKFSFDIYEPHSMGLLLQSMQNAAVKAGYVNYLNDAPYVLRMDIQGYDELGRIIKTVKPKFFTLKLTAMQFTVNEGGSTYKVTAIPYNHQGFSDTINTTYTDLKLYGDKGGKGTVEELLVKGKESLVAVLNRNEQQLVAEKRIEKPDIYDIQFPILAVDWYSNAGNPPSNKKATANPAVPEKTPIKGTTPTDVTPADTRPVNDIGKASLGFNSASGGNIVFKLANDVIDEKTGIVKRDGLTIDPKLRAFQFSQKATLTEIINQIILSSDYAKKAITDKPTAEGYIKWFKLDVQIELLGFDAKVNDYAKKITYRVVPYMVHQSIFANPNSAPVGYNELMKKIVKEYNYIYTGQNTDILKFDVEIKNLFYTGTNPSSENQGAKASNQDQKNAEKRNNLAKTGEGAAPGSQTAQAGRKRIPRDPSLLKSTKGGSGESSTEQAIAENFQHAFISGGSADLVTVNLEILGDPYWLIDSGMGNYFASVPSETSQITNDGTMNYESGNTYVYITFRTPADINEASGLYDFSVAGKESPFGGIYRIVKCENIFQDGFWKQKLRCLRMPGPQGPEATNKTAGTEKLPISKENNNATVTDKQEPAKNSPIESSKSTAPTSTTNTNVATGNSSATTTVSNRNTATPNTAVASTTRFTKRTLPPGVYKPYRDTGIT